MTCRFNNISRREFSLYLFLDQCHDFYSRLPFLIFRFAMESSFEDYFSFEDSVTPGRHNITFSYAKNRAEPPSQFSPGSVSSPFSDFSTNVILFIHTSLLSYTSLCWNHRFGSITFNSHPTANSSSQVLEKAQLDVSTQPSIAKTWKCICFGT